MFSYIIGDRAPDKCVINSSQRGNCGEQLRSVVIQSTRYSFRQHGARGAVWISLDSRFYTIGCDRFIAAVTAADVSVESGACTTKSITRSYYNVDN